ALLNRRPRFRDVLSSFSHFFLVFHRPAVICRAVVISTLASNPLSDYFNPHGTRSSADTLNGRLYRCRIQIWHLLLGNVFYLLQRDLADLVFVGSSRTFGDARCPLQQNGSRRRLGDECERA